MSSLMLYSDHWFIGTKVSHYLQFFSFNNKENVHFGFSLLAELQKIVLQEIFEFPCVSLAI